MKNKCARIDRALLAAFALAGSVSSQSPYRTLTSRELWPNFNGFEPRLLQIQDVNEDGVGEILVGDYSFRFPDQIDDWGKVSVLDGASGDELWSHVGELGPLGNEALGFSVVELGDLDEDGVNEILAGCLSGQARIWSGKNGLEIFRGSIPRVEIVAALGDVDQDGVADFGLRHASPPWGVIDVHSGATLQLLYSARPPFLSYLFGHAIVSLGDVDGDAIPDFAASAPDNVWTLFPECRESFVFVFSGRDGSLLYVTPREECQYLGYSLAAPGDLTGDGIADLVAGLPEVGFAVRGRVVFYDGRTGTEFGEVGLPGSHAFFARSIVCMGDSNGNGYPDFLITNLNKNGPGGLDDRGEAWLLDGGTREFLYRLRGDPNVGPTLPANFSLAMAALGDQDGDDFPEFLIGTTGWFMGPGLGRLDWFSGAPQGVRSVGEPCSSIPGIVPRIGASGIPRIGHDYEVHLARIEPGQKALLAVGFPGASGRRGTPAPGARGLPGCGLLVSPSKLYPAVAARTTRDEAAATVRIPLANDPTLVGQSFLAQWILFGGNGAATTRVLEVTIQDADTTRDY